MSKPRFVIAAALTASLALGATAANAQWWDYNRYQADRAYDSAGIREAQARRDQHAANEAAYYGDYAAADHFARAAQVHRYQAWRNARYAQHESNVARWDYWHGGWGY